MEDLGAEDPRWIGDYRLLRRLGAGGMGRVFLAHSSRGRTVAVKLVQTELAQQAEFRRRFKQEVRAAQRVGGEWTAPVLDADTEAATPWVATGYIAGPSLHTIVAESGSLPERTVRVLGNGLTRALHDIHTAGLVHRDLKPSNILVTIDGPRVIDFGIARALETVTDGLLTRSGAVVGSPGFMSPEQVRGERVTPASDVFCLGSVLAFAATGRQPFGTSDSGVHAVMYRIAQEEPDLGGLPENLRELVTDCLKKTPEDRPGLDALLERTGGDAPDVDEDGTGAGEPWLPGTLVAQLGRHAVQLLEVETPAAPLTPGMPAPPSAPPVAGPARPPLPAPPSTPPPPTAPPSATSFPLAPAEPPKPPQPATPPVPPAPATPPKPAPAPAPAPESDAQNAETPDTAVPSPDAQATDARNADAQDTPGTPAAGTPPAQRSAPRATDPRRQDGAPASAPDAPDAQRAEQPAPRPEGAAAPTPPQAFGPPAVTSFDTAPRGGGSGAPHLHGSTGFGPGGPAGPGGPQGPGGPGGPAAPQPPRRRRRKALIITSAAVATVLIAGAAAVAVLKGNDDKDDKAGPDRGKATHTAPADPGGADTGGEPGGSGSPGPSSTKLGSTGDVPKEYLGAWEGEITESGETTGKIRRIVLSQGQVGAPVADTLTSTEDMFCQTSATLKSADSLLLIEDEEVDTSVPDDACSAVGEQTLRLGNDGSIAWSTTDGSSEATLRPAKSGGKPIPATYEGTWLAKSAFGKDDATLKITIRQGAVGTAVAEEVGDSKKYHCEGKRMLASVSKGVVLSPARITDGNPKDLCTPGDSLTFTASGKDKLRVEYDDPDDYSDETMTQTFTRLN